MSLKYKLDSLDGLDEATKKLYEKKGEKFVLIVEGVEDGDVVGLKNKVETLLAETADLKKKVKENADNEAAAREAERKAVEDAAAKKGDVETIRKSADDRVAKTASDKDAHYKPLLETRDSTIRSLLIDNVAQGLATKIGLKGSETLLIPHITQRLAVEEREGKFVTVIKDSNGKPSALSVDDLEKEFLGNTAFAPVIAGSKANGSGAGGGDKKGGGATGAKQISRAAFDALDAGAQRAHVRDGGTVTE
jgi:hypothetical protein